MSMPEEYITSILSKTAAECNLENWQYSLKSFKSVAQNYFGVLIPLILSGKSGEQNVSKALVLKLAPTDERFRVSGAITLFFAKEIFVYTKLLAKYRKLQNSIALPQYIMPECYYTCSDYCNEAIVMQNMCEEGFQPYTEAKFLDYEHILITLQSLAKFHAFSFILKENDKDLYKEVEKICVPLNEKTNMRFLEVLIDRLEKALDNLEGTGYVPLLKTLKDKCVQHISNIYNSVNNSCICHGDIWKENLLFQYVDDKPSKVCIIDYQTARMSSPAFDVLYLIASSVSSEIRKQSYFQMLDEYYQSLEQTLTASNLDAARIYSRTMFDQDLKCVAPACFIIANTSFWLSNGLQQEGHVKSKIVYERQEEINLAVERYKDIIKGVIDDFVCYNYLTL